MGTSKVFERNSHKAEKGESHSAEKSGNLLLRLLVKTLAHTHRFEHEPSELKSKHLTT